MCPIDLEIEDLTNYWPKKPSIQNDLIGFVHYKCHKLGVKKDAQGDEITRQSNLNYGVRPVFRNVPYEGKIENDRKETLFPTEAIPNRVKFVFTGKDSGDYKLVGVRVQFRAGPEPIVIGNLSPRDAEETLVVLAEDERIVAFHFTQPQVKPVLIL